MVNIKKMKRTKTIKHNEFKEDFIKDFSTQWNVVRRLVNMRLTKYEKLYRNNNDFRKYVDRYMRNKDIALKTVLSLKQIRLVADMYESEEK